MKINGWDISEAKARQLRCTMGNNTISNDSQWIRGAPLPVLCGNTIGLKPLKIVLSVRGRDREEIRQNCSEILSRLIAPAQLTLDYHEHKFFGVLKKCNRDEITESIWHDLILEFEGYEYSGPIVVPVGKTHIIINPGNLPTPAVIEITPKVGLASITVSGICRNPDTGEDFPVTIRNLTTGKKIILDGENGLMTEEGALKAKDIDIWELPVLLPGKNAILSDSSNVEISVKFRPRYM